ncbi:MAG: 30S ribosomal protein S17 [Patescibacteria group bacterium]
MSNTNNTNPRRLTGIVTSNKMQDTAVVAVERLVKHPRYHKYIKTTKKYQVHNAGNTAQVGDTVTIQETKPISKNKRFTIVE